MSTVDYASFLPLTMARLATIIHYAKVKVSCPTNMQLTSRFSLSLIALVPLPLDWSPTVKQSVVTGMSTFTIDSIRFVTKTIR
jgi:hypothetical protein